jgi:hypothetical protein
VTYGSRLRLTGTARGLSQAVLQQRAGGDWQELSSVTAGKEGVLSVVVKPTVTTQYRLASGKVVAAAVRVPVAPLVRFYPVRTQDQLRGYVRPTTLEGTTVFIQRQDGARWVTLTRATVDANGDFLGKLQLTTGVYRARANSGGGFVAGNSPVLQVTAR